MGVLYLEQKKRHSSCKGSELISLVIMHHRGTLTKHTLTLTAASARDPSSLLSVFFVAERQLCIVAHIREKLGLMI